EKRKREEQEAKMRGLGYAGGDEDAPDAKAKAGGKDESPGKKEEKDAPKPPPRKPDPDWLHTNSVDYDADHDLVLFSSPRLSEICVIDHGTTTAEAASHAGGRRGHGGDILWRYGNPKNYGAGGDEERRLFGQHDARWIRAGRPGAGHVLVFNNGEGRPG